MSASIRSEGLGVRFLFDRQRRVVTPMQSRLRRSGDSTWGLRDIDLEVGPGEGLALLGPSGSGKTTLLRALAGVLVPDAGRLEVRGRIGSLLSVQAGLLGLLTGRENCKLLGVLAGLTPREARAEADEVRARTGLGASFERPVTSFSQGMRARLGFAAVDRVDPEILLLDEVHEAFDHEFRDVVQGRGRAIRAGGGIVVAAGHDHELLARLCDRAILLDAGRILEDGKLANVRRDYLGADAPPLAPAS